MVQCSLPSGPPHVLIFPLPAQGHVNSMLRLAELLCLAGLNITFVTFKTTHQNLVRCSDVDGRFAKYPGFQFKVIEYNWEADIIPGKMEDMLRQMLETIKVNGGPIFKRMVIESTINCIIGDMLMGFVYDVANEVGIPAIQFHTISACSVLTCLCIPDIVRAQEIPIKGKGNDEEMDRLITKVPSMEAFLRCRDLPSFCQEMADPNLLMVTNEMRESNSLILNTFEELEGPVLSQIRSRYPKTYTIGPIHQLLKTRLKCVKKEEYSYSSSNSTIQEVDRSCMKWLDEQPPQSVLYLSLGSLTIMTIDQLMEFWYGIINSKKKFLWVIRPESIVSNDGEVLEKIPVEFEVGAKENGYIVGWAPQEEVLEHKAIGGFMTHSGWNSTLESIVAGVPMICWPYFADQQVNSRFVGEVWKLGLDMKDLCGRGIIEKMVNDLMVNRREEFLKSSTKMAELARNSVEESGSSSCCLDRLIEDIKLMSM